jgi:hypothetical protein
MHRVSDSPNQQNPMNERLTRATKTIEAAIDPAIKRQDFINAKETLLACSKATRRTNRRANSQAGSRGYRDEPDHAMRLSASIKILEFAVGKPGKVSRTS